VVIVRLLLASFRPFAQLRIGPGAYCALVGIALFTWAFGAPRAALFMVLAPFAWLAVAIVWWTAYRFWVRREIRSIGYRRVDIPLGKDLMGNSRWDLTGGSRDFPDHEPPKTPSFRSWSGHAIAIGAPPDAQHPQAGVWATAVRLVDSRPWWRRLTIHPRWWTNILTFVHVRMEHEVPGYIFRDRKVIDFGGSHELDLESMDLSRARRFVLDSGEQPVDVAYAIDPPTIEWLLAHPHLEFEANGRDLVLFDARSPLRSTSLAELLEIADALRARIDRATIA
jgi:hypothetical protein